MTGENLGPTAHATLSSARVLADQTFARAAGAPLVPGTTVRILKDAEENCPAWLAAIASAKSTIHFETYIIHRDDTGHPVIVVLISCATVLGADSSGMRTLWGR